MKEVLNNELWCSGSTIDFDSISLSSNLSNSSFKFKNRFMTDAHYVSVRNQANILFGNSKKRRVKKEIIKDKYSHLMNLVLDIAANFKKQ